VTPPPLEIAARRRELLPTRYLHVVCTLPRRLTPLVLQNRKVLYDLLFRTSTLLPRTYGDLEFRVIVGKPEETR
jgi:hypothetical protein